MALSEHQRRARRQEERTETDFAGKRNPGSGNTIAHGNDVRTDRLSIENKSTAADSYRLSLRVLHTVRHHALLDGREPVLLVEIQGEEYAVLEKAFLIELLGGEV